MGIPSRLRAIDTAFATYYVIRACLDPSFITPAIPTRSFWDATFAVQSHGSFLETVRVNLWEGQIASLAWAWDHGRVFQRQLCFCWVC